MKREGGEREVGRDGGREREREGGKRKVSKTRKKTQQRHKTAQHSAAAYLSHKFHKSLQSGYLNIPTIPVPQHPDEGPGYQHH